VQLYSLQRFFFSASSANSAVNDLYWLLPRLMFSVRVTANHGSRNAKMFSKRHWLRFFIVLGMIFAPVMAYLDGGMREAVLSAVTILVVVLCAAGAVYAMRDSQSDDDSPEPSEI
jgi:hypothetical protein